MANTENLSNEYLNILQEKSRPFLEKATQGCCCVLENMNLFICASLCVLLAPIRSLLASSAPPAKDLCNLEFSWDNPPLVNTFSLDLKICMQQGKDISGIISALVDVKNEKNAHALVSYLIFIISYVPSIVPLLPLDKIISPYAAWSFLNFSNTRDILPKTFSLLDSYSRQPIVLSDGEVYPFEMPYSLIQKATLDQMERYIKTQIIEYSNLKEWVDIPSKDASSNRCSNVKVSSLIENFDVSKELDFYYLRVLGSLDSECLSYSQISIEDYDILLERSSKPRPYSTYFKILRSYQIRFDRQVRESKDSKIRVPRRALRNLISKNAKIIDRIKFDSETFDSLVKENAKATSDKLSDATIKSIQNLVEGGNSAAELAEKVPSPTNHDSDSMHKAIKVEDQEEKLKDKKDKVACPFRFNWEDSKNQKGYRKKFVNALNACIEDGEKIESACFGDLFSGFSEEIAEERQSVFNGYLSEIKKMPAALDALPLDAEISPLASVVILKNLKDKKYWTAAVVNAYSRFLDGKESKFNIFESKVCTYEDDWDTIRKFMWTPVLRGVDLSNWLDKQEEDGNFAQKFFEKFQLKDFLVRNGQLDTQYAIGSLKRHFFPLISTSNDDFDELLSMTKDLSVGEKKEFYKHF